MLRCAQHDIILCRHAAKMSVTLSLRRVSLRCAYTGRDSYAMTYQEACHPARGLSAAVNWERFLRNDKLTTLSLRRSLSASILERYFTRLLR
jgi:hypothetical protein